MRGGEKNLDACPSSLPRLAEADRSDDLPTESPLLRFIELLEEQLHASPQLGSLTLLTNAVSQARRLTSNKSRVSATVGTITALRANQCADVTEAVATFLSATDA